MEVTFVIYHSHIWWEIGTSQFLFSGTISVFCTLLELLVKISRHLDDQYPTKHIGRIAPFCYTRKKEKVKKIFAILIILMTLTACSAFQTQAVPEKTATDTPIVDMPNPASVFCIQNGNKNEIVTAEDGSQYGICNFPDGSSCEEWAYYRGECGPASQASPTPEIVVEETVPVS